MCQVVFAVVARADLRWIISGFDNQLFQYTIARHFTKEWCPKLTAKARLMRSSIITRVLG